MRAKTHRPMLHGVSRICALLAAVAVVIGAAGSGSPAAVGQSPPPLPNLPGVPGSPPRGTVSYLLHAEFGLRYEVEWTEEQGDQYSNCSSWRIDSGRSEVVAGSDDWMPGRIEIYPRTSQNRLTGGWATGSAVGKATADIERTWIQRGGTNWTPECGSTAPGSFRPSADDCAGGRTRTYRTKTATVAAQMRRASNVYLNTLTATETPGTREAQRAAFALSVAGRLPYQKCRMSRYAPELPGNIGFLMLPKKQWVEALRNLKPGKTTRFQLKWSGECNNDLPDDAACRFTLDIHVDIRRWRQGIPYP